MAFVSETERDELFKPNKEGSDLGPGQYLPLTVFKFIKPNAVPFLVSQQRLKTRKSETPGPGQYFKEEEKKKAEKLKENALNNYLSPEKIISSNCYSVSMYDPRILEQENARKLAKENYENFGFNSKVKRFKKDKNNNKHLGPGVYDTKIREEAKNLANQNNKRNGIVRHYFNRVMDKYDVKGRQNNNHTNMENSFNEEVFKKTHKKFNFNQNNSFCKAGNKQMIKSNSFSNYETIELNHRPKTNNLKNRKFSSQEKKERQNKILKMQQGNAVEYRIPSIPQKDSRGFEYDIANGKLKKRENPLKKYGFTGNKDNCVGPEQYELVKPDIWHKTGTEWSKYLWQKNKEKIRPQTSYNVGHINCEIGNYRNMEDKKTRKNKKKNNTSKTTNSSRATTVSKSTMQTPNEHRNLFKSYTVRQLNFKDPIAHNIETINFNLNKNKLPPFARTGSELFPGPGYYLDFNKHSGFYAAQKKPIKEKSEPLYFDKENFKEIDRQFEEILGVDTKNNAKSNNELLGPAYYFQENPGDKKRLKQKNIGGKDIVPFNSTSLRFNEPGSVLDDKKLKNQKTLDKGVFTLSMSQNNSSTTNKIIIKNRNNSMNGVKIRNCNFESTINNNLSFEQQSNFSTTNNSAFNITNYNFLNNASKLNGMQGTFYRKERRFIESEWEEQRRAYGPGPGAYISPFTNMGKSNTYRFNGRYMDIRTLQGVVQHNRANHRPKSSNILKLEEKGFGNNNNNNNIVAGKTGENFYDAGRDSFYKGLENTPGVGAYNPEKTFTIMNNVINKMKQGNSSFNTTTLSVRNAIYNFQKFEKNGPGYNYEPKYIEAQQGYAPFSSTEDKFAFKQKKKKGAAKAPEINLVTPSQMENNRITSALMSDQNDTVSGPDERRGPGTYEYRNEVYPWVKPSFNAKYI